MLKSSKRWMVGETSSLLGKISVMLCFALSLPFFVSIPAQAADKELVMFGSRSCVYCQIFKREVMPKYRWSRLNRRAPLREINIDHQGTGGYPLRRGITVTPTFVMFRHGREVARIPGYPGKKNFYKLVNQILNKTK